MNTKAQTERKNMMTTIEREWLSYSEATALSGLSRTTLWSLLSQNLVRGAKVGRAVRISRASLSEYMESQNYADAIRK